MNQKNDKSETRRGATRAMVETCAMHLRTPYYLLTKDTRLWSVSKPR